MAATGLEKGGIYRHFDSKESLAGAAFDYAWRESMLRRQRGMEDCPTALGKLLVLVRNFVEAVPRKLPGGCPLLNTAVDSDDGNPVLRDKARAALADWRSGIAGIVIAGKANGEFRPEVEPESVATILIAGLEGAIMIARLEQSRDPLHAVGDHLEQYLRSLRPERKGQLPHDRDGATTLE